MIRNFLFHRVSEEQDQLWPPMRPELFDRIIKHLVKKYEVVSLEHYLADPKVFSSGKRVATVLFDDGYKDNVEIAAPILQRYTCPASFYVVTDSINRNLPTWTYIIDNVFQQTRKARLELDADFVPEKFKKTAFTLNGVNNPAIREIKPWMKGLPNLQRLQIMDLVLKQCDDVAVSRSKMMNWDDIRQLHNAGFIIGSHSHTHPMLASLSSEGEIKEELENSAGIIQKETGKFPLSISYPIGSFDDRVISLSKAAGYKYGLAVKQQFYDPAKDDLFSIPRVELYQETWWKQRLRITGVYSMIKNYSGRK